MIAKMKKYFITAVALSLILSGTACGDSHGHDEETSVADEHAGHDHDAEKDHDHESESGEVHEGHDHGDGDVHDHDGDHEGHESEIPLDDADAARLGVKTAVVTPEPFSETLRVGGVVERGAEGEWVVSAPRSGRFTVAPGIRVGATVHAAQTIGSVSSAGIEGGDASAAASSRVQALRAEVARLRPLAESGAVSRAELIRAESDLREAEAAAGSVPHTAVAPGAGVITSLEVRGGQFVERGQTIAVISRDTRLTLRADVPSRHAAMARNARTANFRQPGMAEAVSLSAMDGRRTGQTVPDASQGYIPLRFSFANPGSVVPGACAEIWLVGPARESAVCVPRDAIIEIQGVKYVFEKVHKGKYAKHRVTTGGSDGMRIEILSGLNGGEEIVTEGSRVIRMAEISHIAPAPHSHNH